MTFDILFFASTKSIKSTAINLNNAGTDTAIGGLPAKYIITALRAFDASAVPVLATAGLFTSTGGGGTTLAAAAALTTLTSASKYTLMTLAGGTLTDYRTEGTIYMRNVVAQGTALTARFAIEFIDLT